MKRCISSAIIAAAFLAACSSDDGSGSNGGQSAGPAVSGTPGPAQGVTANDRQPYEPVSREESRILSILNAKNQEEIEMGGLARERGQSEDVRAFGEMLIRDHTENAAMVRSVAGSANVVLLKPRDINDMLAREKGLPSAPDPAAELRALRGASFDRAFAEKMLAGHRELIQTIENARPGVSDPNVRDLLDRTLPVLRRHEATASALANR